jgi:hypothetical protein
MVTKTLVNAVASTLPLVNQFDAVLAEQAEGIFNTASLTADLYRADHELEAISIRVGDTLHGVMVSQGELTYGWFEAVRLAVNDAYRVVKVGASDEAVRKAWSRSWKCVTDNYTIEKPASGSSDAEKKAAQRAKQAELLAAFEDKSESELRSEAKSLYNKAGDGDKEAKKQADLIVKAIDTRAKSEAKEAKDSTKAIKAEITALLKKVNDLSVLMDIQIMLEGSVDDAEYEASEI